jgi:acetyl-CoA C-acetyltransferase
VNKVCLSGLNAIAMADQLIGYGEFDVVVAGGMESMTQGPYLLPKARGGYRYGDGEIVDATAHDALYCSFDQLGMGAATETYTKLRGISREDQDAYSAGSHGRAAEAQKNGLFEDEIVAVSGAAAQGRPGDGHRGRGGAPGHDGDTLAKLRPAFAADGTVTAGSSSQISDGPAAVIVMSGPRPRSWGLRSGGDRSARHRRRAGPIAAVPAGQRHQQGVGSREPHAGSSRPL